MSFCLNKTNRFVWCILSLFAQKPFWHLWMATTNDLTLITTFVGDILTHRQLFDTLQNLMKNRIHAHRWVCVALKYASICQMRNHFAIEIITTGITCCSVFDGARICLKMRSVDSLKRCAKCVMMPISVCVWLIWYEIDRKCNAVG